MTQDQKPPASCIAEASNLSGGCKAKPGTPADSERCAAVASLTSDHLCKKQGCDWDPVQTYAAAPKWEYVKEDGTWRLLVQQTVQGEVIKTPGLV